MREYLKEFFATFTYPAEAALELTQAYETVVGNE